MKAKHIILVSALTLGLAMGTAVAVIGGKVIANNPLGAKAADSWTEKAYEAPTGERVGYEHYFLGCPGNYRTSDAEHLVDVTEADITIPQLNVIDASQIDASDKITLINDAKIKWLDQSTTLGTDGGTPVYVNDGGHKALFFSRSNNLTGTEDSEFRFSFSATNLTAVTFEYRYHDFNTTTTDTGSAGYLHAFAQLHNASYNPIAVDFINDDAWHTMTLPAGSYTDLKDVIIKIHSFQGHFFISNLQFASFDDLELEPATPADGLAPVTISDFGITSPYTLPSHSVEHTFGYYDYVANGGIDLWFQYDYENESAQWFYFYLFNQFDEGGIVFRFNNRNEDDGYTPAHIYTVNAYGSGTTVKQTAGADGTVFWYPCWAGVKTTTTNLIHVKAYCINETNNTYRVSVQLGVAGGTMYYPNTLPEGDDTTAIPYFDIELGATYFDNSFNRRIRFSSSSATRNTILDVDADAQEVGVVYKDASGNVIGKKATTTFTSVNYNIDGKILVGWYDQDGNKMENGQTISRKTIVHPIFADRGPNMISLTDVGLNSSLTLGPTDPSVQAPDSYSINTGNRIDFYMAYQYISQESADNYFIFALNFDYIDAATRLMIRIDNNPGNDSRVCGYIYGGPLGNAGDAGTRFESQGNMRPTGYETLIIHVALVDNGNNSASSTIDIINSVTGLTYSISKSQSYSVDWNLTSAFDARNKFGYVGPINCTVSIKDVL